METLDDTLVQVHNWSGERMYHLETQKNIDDAYALFLEFQEWYDQDEEHDIFSLEYIGTGSTYEH